MDFQNQSNLLIYKNKTETSKIFKKGELEENSVCRNFRHNPNYSKNYDTKHYNLDVIISVGYRVKSKQGTQFRIWEN